MPRPPPTSTLFPYTTLFRSSRYSSGPSLTDRPLTLTPRARVSTSTSPNRDRKSTRLNSSHLGISYAVFCLKKKKGQTTDEKAPCSNWVNRNVGTQQHFCGEV